MENSKLFPLDFLLNNSEGTALDNLFEFTVNKLIEFAEKLAFALLVHVEVGIEEVLP